MTNQGNDQPLILTVVQVEVTAHGYPEPHKHVTRVYTPETGRASNKMWFPSDLANTRADKPIIVADLALGGVSEVTIATCPICRTDFFQLPDGVSHSIPGYAEGLDIPGHVTQPAILQAPPLLPVPKEPQDIPVRRTLTREAPTQRSTEHSPTEFSASPALPPNARVATATEGPSNLGHRPEYPYNITDWRESLAESLAQIIGIAGYVTEVESAQNSFYQDYVTGIFDDIADELEMEASGIEFANVSDAYTFPSLHIATGLYDLLYFIYCERFSVRSTLEIVQNAAETDGDNTSEHSATIDTADQISVDGPLYTRRGPVMIDVEGVPTVDDESLTDAIQKDLSAKFSAWLAEYRKRNPV